MGTAPVESRSSTAAGSANVRLPADQTLAIKRFFLTQWIILGLALLIFGGTLANRLYEERKALEALAEERLSLGARSIAYAAERRLASINTALFDLRNNLPYFSAEDDGGAHRTRYLKALADAVDGIRTLSIFDEQGTVTASSRPEPLGKNFSQRAYFRTILRKPETQTLYVSTPFKTILNANTLILARATFDSRSEFSGIVTAALELEDFSPLLESLRYSPEVSAGLVHGSGKVLLYVSKNEILPGTDVSDPSTFFSRHLQTGQDHNLFSGVASSLPDERLAATQTIKPVALSMDVPLVAVVSQSVSSILAPWYAKVWKHCLFLALLTSVAALSLYFYQQRQRRNAALIFHYQADREHDRDRLELATAASGTGIWEFDVVRQALSWNDTMFVIYGKNRSAFSSRHSDWQNSLIPEDLPAAETAFQRAIDQIEPFDTAFRIQRGDGEIRTIQAQARTYVDDAGQTLRLVGINRDVTELQLAEDVLRSAQRLTQQFLDHLPGMAYIKDEKLRVLLANKAFQVQLGIDPTAIIGKTNEDIFPGDFGKKLDADDQQILASGQSAVIEETFADRYFETRKFVIEGEAGKRLLGGITMDITQRRRSSERQKALLKISEMGGTLTEKDLLDQGLEIVEQLTRSQIGFIHFVNEDQESIELVTWTAGALKGCTAAYDSHYPMDKAGIWADCARNQKIVVFNDYPAYLAKKGLPEGHAPLQRMISVPVIEEGKVRLILGVGNKPTDYDDYDSATAQLIGNDLWRIVRRVRVEITLQQKLDELTRLNARLDETNNKLLQSEKLAALGQLAAGVAHEINNPIGYVSSNLNSLSGYIDDLLTVIAAYADVEGRLDGVEVPQAFKRVHQIKSEADYDFVISDIHHLLGESSEGLERVRKIVQDLKDFSRVGETGWQHVDLHLGLESTLNIVWNEIKYKAEVDRDYGNLPKIDCVPSQINQVFMNLLTNAAQSIERHGRIVLRSGCDERTVWVEVEDNGTGIAPENLKQIFEPFFTTKPVGQGTGLGLSLSWGIVQRHHGKIEVRSVLGRGTTFRVILPIDPVNPADLQSDDEASVETT